MIDPRISLAAQAPNLQSSITLFDNTLNNIQNRKMNQQNMQESAELQPLRVQAQQQKVDAGQMEMDNARRLQYLQSVTAFDPVLRPLLQSGNQMGALQALQQRKEQLTAQGRPTETTDDAINQLMNGNVDTVLGGLDMAKAEYQQMVGGQQGLTAGQRERQALIADLESPREDIRKSARIALNLEARPSSAAEIQIARDKELAGQVGDTQASIEAKKTEAKEVARLSSQLKLQPEVDAAVKSAVLLSQNEAERASTNRTNQRALDVYNVGMQGLTSAMDNAWTGPIAGLMPALTSDARVADGAIAAMAPILKSMFRSAGEGTFTDKDQELLVAMIPTRRDDAEARAAKLKNIDAIVRAKLGASESLTQAQSPNPKPSEGKVIRFDSQGNIIQ